MNDRGLRDVAVALWLALWLPGPAFGGPPPGGRTFDQLIADAVAAHARKDWPVALESLQGAYELKPSPELLNNIGRTREELGHYDEAYAIYERLAKDPAAPTALRTLNNSRLVPLQARLSRAWIVLAGKASVNVDGEPAPIAPEAEAGVAPGRRVFEYAEGAGVTLRFHDLKAGRRARIDDTADAASLATLDLTGIDAPLDDLAIDRYRVRANLREVTRIQLPPGTYRVDATVRGRKAQTVDVAVGRDAPFVLASILAKPAPVEKPPVIVAPAPPSYVPWQVTAGAVGAVMAGIGTWLVVDAAQRRDDVNGAETGPFGVVVGIGYPDALDDEEEANRRMSAGVPLLAIGVGLGAAAAIWAILDAADDRPTAVIVPTPAGLSLEGRF